VTNPLSIRCQSNVNPTSLRCQSMPILDQSPNPRPIHQFIANPLDPMPHRPYTDQPNTPSSHLSEPFIKTGLTQDWYALAKITPIYCQSEASSASKQGTSVLEGSLPKCLDGRTIRTSANSVQPTHRCHLMTVRLQSSANQLPILCQSDGNPVPIDSRSDTNP
jgi:hypothetical protein